MSELVAHEVGVNLCVCACVHVCARMHVCARVHVCACACACFCSFGMLSLSLLKKGVAKPKQFKEEINLVSLSIKKINFKQSKDLPDFRCNFL